MPVMMELLNVALDWLMKAIDLGDITEALRHLDEGLDADPDAMHWTP